MNDNAHHEEIIADKQINEINTDTSTLKEKNEIIYNKPNEITEVINIDNNNDIKNDNTKHGNTIINKTIEKVTSNNTDNTAVNNSTNKQLSYNNKNNNLDIKADNSIFKSPIKEDKIIENQNQNGISFAKRLSNKSPIDIKQQNDNNNINNLDSQNDKSQLNKIKILEEEVIKVHNKEGLATFLCYLCGCDFNKTEIEQHINQCLLKHDHESIPDIYKELFQNLNQNPELSINYKEFNTKAEHLISNDNLVSCPLCNRQLNESRIEIHYKLCKAKKEYVSPRKLSGKEAVANTLSLSKKKSNVKETPTTIINPNNLAKSYTFKDLPDSKLIFLQQLENQAVKSNLVCYICGMEQILSETALHIEACEVNFANIQMAKGEDDRLKLPLKPDILNEILQMNIKDKALDGKIRNYNKIAEENNFKDLFFEACEICGRKLLIERMEVHLRVCKKKKDIGKSARKTHKNIQKQPTNTANLVENIAAIDEVNNSKNRLNSGKKNLLYSSKKLDKESLTTTAGSKISNITKPGTTTTSKMKQNYDSKNDKKASLPATITITLKNKLATPVTKLSKKTAFNSTMPVLNKKSSTTETNKFACREKANEHPIKAQPKMSLKKENTSDDKKIMTNNLQEPKEVLFICFICNNEFSQEDIKSHVLSCFEKYNDLNSNEQNQNNENHIDKIIDLSSKCISSIPTEFQEIALMVESGVKIDIEVITRYNEVASKLLREFILKECRHCKRKFMPERIELHQNSCKISNTAKVVGKKGLAIEKKESIKGEQQQNVIAIEEKTKQSHTNSNSNKKADAAEKKKSFIFKGNPKDEENKSLKASNLVEKESKQKDKIGMAINTKISSEILNKKNNLHKLSTLSRVKEESNSKNKEVGKDGLEKCTNCKRTFLPDRLIVHQRSCLKNK